MAGFETVQKRVQELRSLLNYHSKRYYEEDAPEIEDYEYDQMLRELEELEQEAKHPFYHGLALLTLESLQGIQRMFDLNVVTPRCYR